jgi:hypothetical protein
MKVFINIFLASADLADSLLSRIEP